MPIVARCPSPGCRGSYRIPDDRATTAIRCPLCKKTFTPTDVAGLPQTKEPLGGTASSSSPSPSTGSLHALEYVSRFLILGRLGSGAFGTVFKARDPQLERDVALKVPNPGMLDTPKRVERFLREAKAAARLRHPNIVPVFDAGKDGERYYIASAFVDGKPLSEIIEERGIEFRRAAEIVQKLAEAVAYAHDQGIVHRDIKPSNVMLDSSEQPHLMDFGLAARADEAEKITNDGAVLGTPAYMSPEQAGGQRGEASPLSDQYALGVVLYELLTGQPPFSGPPAAVVYKVIHHDPPMPRSLRPYAPCDLETICLKAMAKKPEARYTSCQTLADDLKRWLQGEPIDGRRHSPLERVVRTLNKNRVLAACLTFVVAMSIFFAADARERSHSAEEARKRADDAAAENERLLRVALGLRDEVNLSKADAERLTTSRQTEIDALRNMIGNLKGGGGSVKDDKALNETQERLVGAERSLAKLRSQGTAVGLQRPQLYANVLGQLDSGVSSKKRSEMLSHLPVEYRNWEARYLATSTEPSTGTTILLKESNGEIAAARIVPKGDALYSLAKDCAKLGVLSLVS